MKKTILLLAAAFLAHCVQGQIIMTDSVRHALCRYLYDKNEAASPDAYDSPNLWIHSLFTDIWYDDTDMSTQPLDILSVSAFSSHPHEQIVLLYKNTHRMLDMNRPYADIMAEVLDFFRAIPDVDERFLPLFMHRVHCTFMRNTRRHQLGPWYDLWNGRDSTFRRRNLDYSGWVE